MATLKKLLAATLILDDAITDAATLIYTTLNPLGLDEERTFYLYQDFTSSTTLDENKEQIGHITLTKRDFVNAGFDAGDSPTKVGHFIRSKIYQKLAQSGTLKYFNRIRFVT